MHDPLPLFRPEAVAHATRRLAGDVVLAAPLPLRLTGLVLAGVVAAALLLAATATYARKASVTGWLVPDRGLIRATAPQGGRIASLLVAEGDRVAQGQRLAELQLAAEIAGGNAGEAVARGLTLEAEAVKARAETQAARLVAERAETDTRIGNLRVELGEVERQAALQEDRVRLADEAATDTESIAAQGFVSKRELEQRHSTALAARQDLAGLHRQEASIRREMADLAARLAALPIEAAAVRAETQSAEAALSLRAVEAEQRRAVFIAAPVAGHVAALPVIGGQPLAAGATLAVIIPDGGKLEAELLAPSRAAGFIEPGQEVHLQVQAFPYQRFGMVRGTVTQVSRTVLGPADIAIPGLALQEPVFRLRVALARQDVAAYGRAYPLQPGMLLAADIVLDRRSLLQWLFDPLYAVGRRR